MYVYMYIYIYICTEIERERENKKKSSVIDNCSQQSGWMILPSPLGKRFGDMRDQGNPQPAKVPYKNQASKRMRNPSSQLPQGQNIHKLGISHCTEFLMLPASLEISQCHLMRFWPLPTLLTAQGVHLHTAIYLHFFRSNITKKNKITRQPCVYIYICVCVYHIS